VLGWQHKSRLEDQAMTHTTTTGLMPKNLELERELIADFIFEMAPLHSENEHIEQLLDAGYEYELILLPGESLGVSNHG
jgi:hypothetical protein